MRYTIRMPRAGRLTIRDHRSEIEVADFAGALDINTHRGTVNVARLSGPLQLMTHRGEAKIEFARFSASSSVDTHRGSMELLLPRNSGFELKTDMDRHASLTTDFAVMTSQAGRERSSMRGAVNGGGPTLTITSHRGDIKVRGM